MRKSRRRWRSARRVLVLTVPTGHPSEVAISDCRPVVGEDDDATFPRLEARDGVVDRGPRLLVGEATSGRMGRADSDDITLGAPLHRAISDVFAAESRESRRGRAGGTQPIDSPCRAIVMSQARSSRRIEPVRAVPSARNVSWMTSSAIQRSRLVCIAEAKTASAWRSYRSANASSITCRLTSWASDSSSMPEVEERSITVDPIWTPSLRVRRPC